MSSGHHSLDTASRRSSRAARRAGIQAANAVTTTAAATLATMTVGRSVARIGWPRSGWLAI